MTGPTVVFLHHFGGSARSWDAVIAGLGGAFEIVALDLPGFGDAAGAPGPYTVAGMADHVEAKLRAQACPSFILVGHSMGGKVALAVAARRPAGLQALLLLAPSPSTPEPIAEGKRSAAIAGWAEYSVASQTLAEITALPLAEERRRLAIRDMMRAGKAAWTAWLDCGSREDLSDDIGGIEVPVTVLSGTCDSVLPTDLIRREVAARLPGANLIEVVGAGHLLPLEAPEAVAQEIMRVAADLDSNDAPPHVGSPETNWALPCRNLKPVFSRLSRA